MQKGQVSWPGAGQFVMCFLNSEIIMVLTNSSWLYSRISYGKPKMFLCVFIPFRFNGVQAVPPAFPLEKLIHLVYLDGLLLQHNEKV